MPVLILVLAAKVVAEKARQRDAAKMEREWWRIVLKVPVIFLRAESEILFVGFLMAK